MKNTQRLFALLLAVVMVLSMAVTAFADDAIPTANVLTEEGTITIANAAAGTVYKIYRIFDIARVGTPTGTDTPSPNVYIPTAKWKDFVIAQATAGKFEMSGDYVTAFKWEKGVDQNGNEKAAAQMFAEAVVAHAGTTIAADGTSVELRGSGAYQTPPYPYGYYVMVSSRETDTYPKYTVFALDQPNVTIEEKNNSNVARLEKSVQEDDTLEWGTTNEAETGEIVNFKIELYAVAGTDPYYIRDDLTGFKDIQILVVKNDHSPLSANDYTLTTTSDGFVIHFTQSYRESFTDDDLITITYTAKLDDDAQTGYGTGKGNVNKVVLDHDEFTDNNANAGLLEASTTTYTYELDVEKVNEHGNPLAGAKFQLLENGEVVKMRDIGNRVYIVDDNGTVESIETTTDNTESSGTFVIKGLDGSTTYVLDEIQAPGEYIPMDDMDIVIDKDNVEKTIENLPGVSMPETGGMGTTIIYAVGGLMVLAAVVLLVTKKRMAA